MSHNIEQELQHRNDQLLLQLSLAMKEIDLLKQGRTNQGDVTGGTVTRFGIDASKLPLEIIPATNGAYVWYSDYADLYALFHPHY